MAKRLFQYRRTDWFAPGASVVVRREPAQTPSRQHVHDFVELVVILSGAAIHRVGRFRYRLAAGDVFVISPDRAHGYEEPEGLNLANILIREDFFARTEPAFSHLEGYHTLFTLGATAGRAGEFASRMRLGPEDLERMSAWIDRLEEEASRHKPDGSALAEAWLTVLVGFLARAGTGRASEARTETRFGRLLSWIEQNCARKIRLAEMARIAAMSERTLLRRFQETTGGTAMDHVLEVRLRHARQLIERGGEGLSAIAESCGFESANYLSRMFKRRFGLSPRSWKISAAGEPAGRRRPGRVSPIASRCP